MDKKKVLSLILVFAMVAACVCMTGCKKKPTGDVGTERQQQYAQLALDTIKAAYGDYGYSMTFTKDCYICENAEPGNYGHAFSTDYDFTNIAARVYLEWTLAGEVAMKTTVFIDMDGNADYYSYIDEETAMAQAEESAEEMYAELADLFVELYYNRMMDANEAYIPTAEDLASWKLIDITLMID